MHRRTLLRGLVAATGLGLAGCTGPTAGAGDDGDGGGNATDPSPTDDPTGVTDRTFEVLKTSSTSPEDEATVTFEPAADRVRITGTIVGSDGCKTAALESLAFDGSELVVSVTTEDREGSENQACTMALVAIEYEATVTVAGGLPDEVTAEHDGESVTTARRNDGGD